MYNVTASSCSTAETWTIVETTAIHNLSILCRNRHGAERVRSHVRKEDLEAWTNQVVVSAPDSAFYNWVEGSLRPRLLSLRFEINRKSIFTGIS